MAHYFTNEDLKSEEKEIKVNVRGKNYTFITDNGVFSKKGLDFGTRTLLETLPDIKGDILDLGCGWGPIGITLADNASVDMVDINERSVFLARKNAKINNKKVNIFVSNIYEKINKKYDYIITNPPIRVGKTKLLEILEGAFDHLEDNGILYFVIRKDQGALSIKKILEEQRQVEIINKDKGYFIFKVK